MGMNVEKVVSRRQVCGGRRSGKQDYLVKPLDYVRKGMIGGGGGGTCKRKLQPPKKG